MPGVVVVEDGGGVERPAGFSDLRWGIGPAVADYLINTHEEVEVGLGFHVERCSAKDRGMEPGEGLGRGDVIAEKMVCGGCPPKCGEFPPTGSFALRKGNETLAGQANRWFSICLGAKFCMVFGGPVIDLSEVVFVD